MENFLNVLNYVLFENTVKEYFIALGVFVLVCVILRVVKSVVISRIRKFSKKTATDVDDLVINILDSFGFLLYLFLGLYLAFLFLELPSILEKTVSFLLLIVLIYYLVKASQKIVDYGVGKLSSKLKEKEEGEFDSSAIKLLGKVAKGVLWGFAIILALQNLGYNVSTLIAGLGISGIAVAFAIQNILGDIFASFSIYFDKPFQVGDFIVVNDNMGNVKKIGLKSTRIETFQGEELVLSNKQLTETGIHNYKKIEKRRVVFPLGVSYSTSQEKLKKIPGIIKNIIDNTKLAETDRVHFKEFGDFSLNFEVVYFANTSDYKEYMDARQEINLGIKDKFEKERIEIAFPTQTIFLNKK